MLWGRSSPFLKISLAVKRALRHRGEISLFKEGRKQSADEQDCKKLQGHPSRTERDAQHGAKDEQSGKQGGKTEVFQMGAFVWHSVSFLRLFLIRAV